MVKVCRRGHPLTPSNTYYENGYQKCLTCRRASRPMKGRKCIAPDCGVEFFERGNKSSYCPAHRHLSKWRRRTGKVPESAFPKDSPWEKAVQYILDHFGVGRDVYFSRPDHPLSLLHYAVMARFYNELPDTPSKLAPLLSEEECIRRAIAAGYPYRDKIEAAA